MLDIETAGSMRQAVPSKMWRAYAAGLAHQLVLAREVGDRAWADSFAAVPRHHFVTADHEIENEAATAWRRREPPSDLVGLSGWLARTYDPVRTAVVDLSEADPWGKRLVTTECPSPTLAARMLTSLDVHRGMRVLEIGTGTGYLTALIAHRVGADAVTTIEIDPTTRDRVERTLGEIGVRPNLLAGDGNEPLPDQYGFDRIIVGYATDEIATAWTRLLRPGGVLLVRLQWPLGDGRHITLHRDDDRPYVAGASTSASGSFVAWTGTLPARRRPAGPYPSRLRPYSAGGRVRSGSTFTDPAAITGTPLSVLAQAHLGPDVDRSINEVADGDMASFLQAVDGSWAEISHAAGANGRRDIRWSGERRLVPALEAAQLAFEELGRPRWSDVGLTVRDGECRLRRNGDERTWILRSRRNRWW